jgi:hypothetical protein
MRGSAIESKGTNQMLTVETAVAYLASQNAGQVFEILSATVGTLDGLPVVIVLFKADGFTYDATCWLEAGRVYGEW